MVPSSIFRGVPMLVFRVDEPNNVARVDSVQLSSDGQNDTTSSVYYYYNTSVHLS
jgi:hypothetical protein